MKVAGHNYFSILCAESNNQSVKNQPSISPPVNSRLEVSSLLSYSVYDDHAVWVFRDGRAFALGNATNGKVCGKLSKSLLSKQTEITISDPKGKRCLFVSAVCGTWYTLYLLETSEGHDHLKLAYSCYNKEIDSPMILDTGKLNPVALYGGSTTAAAIDQEGYVIIITESIFKTSNPKLPIVTLPNNQRAVSVGCLEQSYFILSENGIVYKYVPFPSDGNEPELKEVEELREMKIVQISATAAHCLAVTSDGRVFGRGLNDNGRMGIASQFSKIFTFTQVTELKSYKIIGAYAGCHHSLFMTSTGQVLACGANYNGELLLNSGPSEKDVLTPQKTVIEADATFCITGIFLSAVFVKDDPPPNTPNLRFDNADPEYPNPKAEIRLPSEFTSMAESEIDRIILRPISNLDDTNFDDSIISSSVSNFEARILQEQNATPRTLNKDVVSLDQPSGSSKHDQNPISSILGIGERLAGNSGQEGNSAGSKRSLPAEKSQASKQNSSKGSEKPLSSASNAKKTTSAANKLDSEKSKQSAKGAEKTLSSGTNPKKTSSAANKEKGLSAASNKDENASAKDGPISSILNIGEKLANPNQMSSASNISDKPADNSNKDDKINSMTRSISSEKANNLSSATPRKTSSAAKKGESSANNKASSKAEEKAVSSASNAKKQSSAANKVDSEHPSQKSAAGASEKSKSTASKTARSVDKNLSAASNDKKQSSAANKVDSEHPSQKSAAGASEKSKSTASKTARSVDKNLSAASNDKKQSSAASKVDSEHPSQKSAAEASEKNQSAASKTARSVDKNLSAASNDKKLSSATSPKKTSSTPRKAPTSEEEQKPFYFESNPDQRATSGSKLSMNSELQQLRKQNSEMKELLASKDKEIVRLTKLNETFIGNNKDLQSNLVECWDNQKHKIDKLDTMNNSKRRKK